MRYNAAPSRVDSMCIADRHIAKGMPFGRARSVALHFPAGAESYFPVFSGFRPETPEERPSKIRLVIICRPSRRRWHCFVQPGNLSVGLQGPHAGLPTVERPQSRRGLFTVATPCAGCNASPDAYWGQAQDFASGLILFLAGDIVAGLLTDRGPSPVLLVV